MACIQRNVGQTNGPIGLDLNVEPVWIQGFAGKGVVVGVVDDGTSPFTFPSSIVKHVVEFFRVMGY